MTTILSNFLHRTRMAICIW